MAFGRIKKRREKKRKKVELKKQEQATLKQEAYEAQDPIKIGEELQKVQAQVSDIDLAGQGTREEERKKHSIEALEDVSTEVPGMTEHQKRAMQESANSQIDSQIQNYARQMAGGISRSGRRGGTVFAQQSDLAQKGLSAQNQFQRDLVEKDSEVALQKLAAYMASLQGKQSDDVLRRQQLYDYISGRQGQKRQDIFSQYYGSRI